MTRNSGHVKLVVLLRMGGVMSKSRRLEIVRNIMALQRRIDKSQDAREVNSLMNLIYTLKAEHAELLKEIK